MAILKSRFGVALIYARIVVYNVYQAFKLGVPPWARSLVAKHLKVARVKVDNCF